MEVEALREYLSRGAILVVQITPFKEDESLDIEGLRLNTEFLVEKKSLGPMVLVPTGSTGEFYALNDEERKKVISTVVDVAGGKIPVIAGTMRAGAKWTVELSKYAEDIGVDGVMVVLPYYHVPGEDGLLEYFKKIANSINIGLLIYNNPDVSKIYVNPRLMKRLVAEIPNLVGVKENTPYIATFYEQVKAVDGRIPVIQGRGEWWYISTVLLGATGYVSGYANFMPELSFEILKAGISKNFSKLGEFLERISILEEFISDMNIKYGPSTSILPPPYIQGYMVYAVIKAAMDIIGLRGGRVRLPLLDLKREDRKHLERILFEDLFLEKRG
ncbi:MAG: dihydrodipicolinate synthase family protein [Nitrososphaerota archaeon]|nr:dihydrodipicolinate synthase family protein [Candidatus Bathyarchaeota archaeon]MDW8061908.1 dihydrodipicolinate synthase family protein [Nitrososphaerota archaeon]